MSVFLGGNGGRGEGATAGVAKVWAGDRMRCEREKGGGGEGDAGDGLLGHA